MNTYRLQEMTFRQKALYELRMAKAATRPTFWVKVKPPHGREKWYQLPRDLQRGMWQNAKQHHNNGYRFLLHKLIVIPLSDYDNKGQAKLGVGQVTYVTIRRKHIRNPRWITRSQFKGLEYHGPLKLLTNRREVIAYLQHDHSPANKARIKDEVNHYVKRHRQRQISSLFVHH